MTAKGGWYAGIDRGEGKIEEGSLVGARTARASLGMTTKTETKAKRKGV